MAHSGDLDPRPLAVGMLAGVAATAFEAVAVATAMPAAAADLGHVEWYAWVFSLFMAGMLTGSVVGGRLADRRGPLVPVTSGMGFFLAGLLISGLATTMPQLLVGRLVQGLGAGALNVSLYFVVAHAFEPRQRPLLMTGFSASWILPAFVGPPLAGLIARVWSWHWVFLGIVPLILVASALMVRPLLALDAAHEPAQETAPVPVWVGLSLSGAAIGLQYAGQRFAGERDGWVLLGLVGGMGLLVVAIPRLMPRGFVRLGRGLPAVVATRTLIAGAFFGAEAFIPLMLVETRAQSLTAAGMMLTVGSAGWFVGSWLQSRRWLPLTRHQMIGWGSVAVAAGIAGCAAVAWSPGLWLGAAWAIWPLAGLGMGFVAPSVMLALIALSPPAQQGRNGSALTAGDSLGNAVFTGVAGTIFAALHTSRPPPIHFGLPLTAMVAVACLATWAAVRIGPVPDGD